MQGKATGNNSLYRGACQEIGSNIDNIQLLTGLGMIFLSFFIYIFSGVRFFLFFANVPILIMLYIFYIRRNRFILINSLKPGKDY
jgi:hypothetical protein